MAEFLQSEIQVVKPGEIVNFDGTYCEFSGRKDKILKVAAKIVLDKLKECRLLCGIYDAKNGNEHYMYGISTVMEMIANYAGDDEFEEMFMKNMADSEEKCK